SATVTGVTSTNVASNIATESNGTLVIEGQYGTLTIKADGTYTYQLDNSNSDVQELIDGESLDEVFNYTLTDGDNDTNNASLTITIDGKNDGVTVEVPNNNEATTPDANNEDQVVFESGLTDGSAPDLADTQVSNQ
ncbi:VCBS domain-containing protein, partial [Oceanimonas smirnovii]|uniref:VCBS domain-containing protein n=1 Tax=Oceanimonas smirnovii TaxID=264574 RepID=UPI0037705D05